MRVIRLTLAYDGTDFRGWALQRDPGVRTIEGSLVAVLEGVMRHDVRLSVAGRTDAGVHARGQVASFVTPSQLAPERIQKAVNGRVAPEIVVVEAREAREGFDARFSATAREYGYAIDTAPVADPFTARYVWHRPVELSIGSMRAAARHLVGEHDFTSFCRHPGPGKPTVRDLAAGLDRAPGLPRDATVPRQRVPPPDGPDGRGNARPGRRGQARAAGRSDHARGSEALRAVAAGAATGSHARTRVLRDASGDRRPVVTRASFDGVAFPQVALPIGRDARPISHV